MKLNQVVIAVPTNGEKEVIRRDFKEAECKWIVCGVGPAMAAQEVTAAILKERPSLVILVGICGIFKSYGRLPGSLFIAQSETYGDLGRCTGERIEPIVIAGNALDIHFDLMPYIAAFSLEPFLNQFDISLGHMVTVSCTSSSEDRPLLGSISRKYICENMEGAGVAQACVRYGVPLLEIRAGSNLVGDQNPSNWQIKPALKNLSKAMVPLLEHIKMI